jgi:hypothetical protein
MARNTRSNKQLTATGIGPPAPSKKSAPKTAKMTAKPKQTRKDNEGGDNDDDNDDDDNDDDDVRARMGGSRSAGTVAKGKRPKEKYVTMPPSSPILPPTYPPRITSVQRLTHDIASEKAGPPKKLTK